MLSYLHALKDYWNGPFVNAEVANLRRQFGSQRFRWLSRIGFVIAMSIASIPFWLQMIDSPRNMILFAIIILAVYIVQLNLAIKTLTLASHTIAREAVAENWDSFILTGVDARKIVLAKWLAVLKCVWRDYLWEPVSAIWLAACVITRTVVLPIIASYPPISSSLLSYLWHCLACFHWLRQA